MNDSLNREVEFLQEQRMILTIALAKIRTKAVWQNLNDIKVLCDVALVEAGDEDYYDD
jgi:hypothetical protein